jgi:hypothetical protein
VFEAKLNQEPCTITDRPRVEKRLDPEEKRIRFPKPDAG